MKQAGIRPLFFYIVFSPNRLPRICVFLYMLYMIITCIICESAGRAKQLVALIIYVCESKVMATSIYSVI